MAVSIDRLNYVAVKAADPAGAAAFAERMGFSLAHVDDDGRHYLKAKGPDPYSLVYAPGEQPGIDHLSYLVADADVLAAAPGQLAASGVESKPVERPLWGQDAAVALATPAGHSLQLTTGVSLTVPPGHAAPLGERAAPAPIAADHVGLGAVDFEAEESFWLDALGLLHSSRIFVGDGPQVMSFLRAPGSYLYHCVVTVRSPVDELHHLQFSLKTVDDFEAAHASLVEAGVDIRWGPLRHGPGHNIAMYFQDGAGYWVEYSVEEEIVLDDERYEPRSWNALDPHAVDEWGTGPLPPAELMPPPPPPPPEEAAAFEEIHRRVEGFINKKLYACISRANKGLGMPTAQIIRDHMEWALEAERTGRIFASGPFVTEEGGMQGDGLLVVRAETEAAARELLDRDPLHSSRHRSYELQGWMLHQGNFDLAMTLSDGKVEVR